MLNVSLCDPRCMQKLEKNKQKIIARLRSLAEEYGVSQVVVEAHVGIHGELSVRADLEEVCTQLEEVHPNDFREVIVMAKGVGDDRYPRLTHESHEWPGKGT